MTKDAEAKSFGEILEAADKLSLEEREALIDVYPAARRIAGVACLAGIFEKLVRNSKRAKSGRRPRMIFYRKYFHEATAAALQLLCSFSTRLIRKNPGASEDIRAALHLLREDAFHPLLKTHKPRGKLEGSWARSAGYDLWIIFEFVQYEGSEATLLETIGTHQEVY